MASASPPLDAPRIRLASGADSAAVRAIYAPIVEKSFTSFELAVPSVEEMARRILEHRDHPWIVAEADGIIAGYAYASPFSERAAYRWSVQTSVYVDAPARGRGIGRSLYVSLLRLLAAQGFRRAMAGIALPNPASVALHESLGFTPVGVHHAVGWKLGGWRDVGWWERELAAASVPGRAPRPPRALHRLPPAAVEVALRGAMGA